jgi:hypothetical protein
VHVARHAFDEAERELDAGIASQATEHTGPSRFSGVALHWLRGLLHLARGDEPRALELLERELSFESSGHLYARECCANTWYAIGAIHTRGHRLREATAAFQQALARMPRHPLAKVGLAVVGSGVAAARPAGVTSPSIDAAIAQAVQFAIDGNHADEARLGDQLLSLAPPGNAGWLLPIEPLLNVAAAPEVWSPVLARLRTRAA